MTPPDLTRRAFAFGLSAATLAAGTARAAPAPAAPGASRRFSPAELRSDLRFLVDTIRSTHPEPAFSMDPTALDRAVASLGRRLSRPLDRDRAWAEFARLNPVFADGHVVVSLPDWRGEAGARVAAGDPVFFPFEVGIDDAGDLRVVSALGGGPTEHAGGRIERIGGEDARAVMRALLERVHGDTPAMRRALLARRWWFFYWKVYGASSDHDLLIDGRRTRVRSSAAVPAVLADEASFERQYRLDVPTGRSAVLTAGSFSWSDEQAFVDFCRAAFERIRQAGSDRLVIDLRANGGGNDSFWIRGLMPYIARRPYRWASRYRKRVLAHHRQDGETVGDVVNGEVTRLIPHEPDNPLRFAGQVDVLVGPLTYSSAVLFANTVQDHGFGRLAGTGGAVRTRQSGGTQFFTLPATGLSFSCPRFVLERPSGAVEPRYLTPDLTVAEDPLKPSAAIAALLAAPASAA